MTSALVMVGVVLAMVFAGVCMGACVRTHWHNPNQPLRWIARRISASRNRTR
jgi:hypothetical protein